MRIAVIDLGTNTCNLLIAEINKKKFCILHQSKQLVKLGDDKIKANEISQEATLRTLNALKILQSIINDFQADEVQVIATSAVRSAENKIEFIEQISKQTGWVVKVITGENEAEFIFKGVLLAFGKITNPSIILDIGGGSNELILTNNNKLTWKESRPTGMARVINHFQISDPITFKEVITLQNFFSKEHQNAFCISKDNSVKTLIGCSGAFDTIADIIDEVNPGEKLRTTQEISIEKFNTIYNFLLNSIREQRLSIRGMDMVRVDLIVPAVILINQLITEIRISKIIQTDFALREGVLYDYLSAT